MTKHGIFSRLKQYGKLTVQSPKNHLKSFSYHPQTHNMPPRPLKQKVNLCRSPAKGDTENIVDHYCKEWFNKIINKSPSTLDRTSNLKERWQSSGQLRTRTKSFTRTDQQQSINQGKWARKSLHTTVLHEATLSFLCTVYVPSSTNEAHTHKNSPQATKWKRKKEKE